MQDKVEVPDSKYSKQKLLLGTHTSEEEQNHLLLAEVHLPTEDSELSSAQYDEESAEVGGYGASPGRVSMKQHHITMLTKQASMHAEGCSGILFALKSHDAQH